MWFLKGCLKNYEVICFMLFYSTMFCASDRYVEFVLCLTSEVQLCILLDFLMYYSGTHFCVLDHLSEWSSFSDVFFIKAAQNRLFVHSAVITEIIWSSCWILIEAHISPFYFQIFVSAVLQWWPFTFRPLGVQYRGSSSACVKFSQHHTFRKSCCSMKAAPERPCSPVFCLHGPLQKLVWRGGFWKPGPLNSAWQGETWLFPARLFSL